MGFRTLPEMLHDAARDGPERIALGSAGAAPSLTYAEVDALVDELAGEVRRGGVDARDTVAIASDNCVELVLALFAVSAAGAVAAPIDPALQPREIAARLDAVGAKAMIVPEHLYERFATARLPSPIWRLSLERSPDRLRPALVAPNLTEDAAHAPRASGVTPSLRDGAAQAPRAGDVALLLFTTGTTQGPKVVPLTHANLSASVGGSCATYRLTPEDATLLVMPLFHGHGLIGALLATLASGGAAHVPPRGRFSAGGFWRQMIDARATWYTAVPTVHQILLARAATDYPKARPPQLRFVRSCSAPIAASVARAVESAFGAPLVPAYGMTETAHQATSNPLPVAGVRKAASVGVPTGLEVQIVEQGGRGVERGVVGEVRVRGPAVTSGYLHAPEANATSFVDGWFCTGDLGYEDEDGYLFLQGRIKELVNRGGEKISPSAVDAVLAENPKVAEAMSFGVPDDEYGEEIVAAIVLQPGERASASELARYALSRLSAFEAPKRFYFLDALPRTAKGAGDRRKLTAMFTAAQAAEATGPKRTSTTADTGRARR
ncbi:MAG: AMP-binding protein [Labilithrix sp.]|nr:AMP-binding protein [Labilithrix sp.]